MSFTYDENILTDIMILQNKYTGRKCDDEKYIFKLGSSEKD